MFSALYNNFADAGLSNTLLKVNFCSAIRDGCWIFTRHSPEAGGPSFGACENTEVGYDGEMTICFRVK